MADHTTSVVKHTESTISSVRSTISTASSGYAIVSVPGHQRGDVRNVYTAYPYEPPPDYDTSPRHSKEIPITKSAGSRSSSPEKEYESRMPLLISEACIENKDTQKTIVRINSRSQDLSIEIVSSNPGSPNSATDSSFLYHAANQKANETKCCRHTLKEKCLFVCLLVVILALVLVILNFTVCMASLTSACP